MSGITVLSANPALETSLVDLYGRSLPVRRVWSDRWRDATEAATDACADDPELVIIGADVHPDQALAVVEELHRDFPTTILCLVPERDAGYSMKLLRQGARDVVIEKGASEEFKAELDPVIRIARNRTASPDGSDPRGRQRTIAVISPKGGTGKTTVSTHLATVLARRRPTEVVLVDLDVQFGDCAPALGLTPAHSLVDAIAGLDRRPQTLRPFLADHPSGLLMLDPPDDLVAAEQIEPEHMEQVLVVAALEFPYVVVDTASGIDAASLAAIEAASDLVVVSSPDAPSVRAARRQLDTLDQLGYDRQRRTLVLNRSNTKGGLPVPEVQAAIGLEVDFQIPNTRLIAVATNEGVPIVERGGSSLAARAFEDMATRFVPEAEPGSGERRGRFRGRRSSR